MEANIELVRVVSILRSLLRSEVENCAHAIEANDQTRARREISEVSDKLKRAINVLNCLR